MQREHLDQLNSTPVVDFSHTPSEAKLKIFLKGEIVTIIRARNLGVSDVSKISGESEADLFDLPNKDGHWDLCRLVRLLTALGADVAIGVKRTPANEKGYAFLVRLDD
jgi:hypothetical protein